MIDRIHDSEEQAQMQKLMKIVTLSLTLTLVTGCSYLGVYKRDLVQGNLVTQDAVSQLQPGMSRSQVKAIMGSPLLEAPFSDDEWDYLFRLDKAYGGVDKRRVTLSFENNRLVDMSMSGDFDEALDFTAQPGMGPDNMPEDDSVPLRPGNAPTVGTPIE
ncbi:Beta-barrel assembly machine subunit BamE [Onishia taeanensis]|jgi:outer membrane protein assembly factor BamE|uniref:Outer membrane protein assembly factor BamE n=2 Tax=Onishia taeanensis TaxID=284577 RepID=A0A1G7T7T8_9GAMM|nr:Beta-barrel assembly machine subunit BamE [Halomonas taeanensis]